MPGQKHPTPPLGDGTRAFYETLYSENPGSKMAEKWLFEHGVFDQDTQQKLFKKYSKK